MKKVPRSHQPKWVISNVDYTQTYQIHCAINKSTNMTHECWQATHHSHYLPRWMPKIDLENSIAMLSHPAKTPQLCIYYLLTSLINHSMLQLLQNKYYKNMFRVNCVGSNHKEPMLQQHRWLVSSLTRSPSWNPLHAKNITILCCYLKPIINA